MKIFVFGNPDLEMDSLPLRILPELRKEFPEIEFEVRDPNEEWAGFESKIVAIDAALGIKDVITIEDLNNFSPAPRLGMHDFDAFANLKFLMKIGKIKSVKIIALPPEMGEKEAIRKISEILNGK